MKSNLSQIFGKNLIWVFIILFFAVYTFFSIIRHIRYDTFVFDLGYYDQILWRFAQGKGLYSSIIASHTWSDHFSPSLLLLSPLYKIYSSPIWLLIVQSLVICLGAYPLFKISLGKTKSVLFSNCLSLSYLCFWGIMGAISFDFHPLALGAPLLLFVIWFYERNKRTAFWITLLIFAGLQENYFLFVAFLGIYIAAKYRNFKLGISLLIIFLILFLIVIFYLIPSFNSNSESTYSYLSNIKNVWSGDLLEKFKVVAYSFGSFSFLPLLSPFSWILLVEEFVGRFVASNTNWWSLGFHYNSLLSSIMSLGVIDTVIRFKPPKRIVSYSLLLSTAIALLIVKPDTFLIFNKSFYDFQKATAYDKAISQIPKDSSVAAANDIGGHLSEREDIQFLANCLEDTSNFGSDSRRCYDHFPDFMIADLSDSANWNAFYPDYDRGSIRRYFSRLVENGSYTIYYSDGAVKILKKLK